MSKIRPLLLGVLALGVAGCSDQVWYRAAGSGSQITIVRADLEANSCAKISISALPPGMGSTPVEDISVDFPDAEFAYVAYVAERGGADRCTTDNYVSSVDALEGEGSGKLRLREVGTDEGRLIACKARLAASFAGIEFRGSLPVWDEACPEPTQGERRRYDQQLRAHYAFGLLTVYAYDADTSTCTYTNFEYAGEFDDSPELIEPEGWRYAGTGILHIPLASLCTPDEETFANPNTISLLSPHDRGRGRLTFETSEPGVDDEPSSIPCRIGFEIEADTRNEYHWAPRYATISGAGVVVEGACEG